jgi:DNA (cytosine-5)-methyltransferase 1
MKTSRPTYYEFFAGGGMARAGLGDGWQCLFANDFDQMKAATYAANWGSEHLLCEDVAKVRTSQLPGVANLAWASFPCQDLSLAGDCLGLGSAASAVMTRSGTFWPFWALMRTLKKENRAPRIIVLENVYGVLTSRNGKDFSAICSALSGSDYRFGAVVVDAARFVPQSRQRVFFIAVESSSVTTEFLASEGASAEWHPRALIDAHSKLSESAKRKWLWWNPTAPASRTVELPDLIEDVPSGVEWHTKAQTAKLLGMMSPLNKAKVTTAQQAGKRMVGCLYKRTRVGADGVKHQRAEVRFDGVAGCLRTPGGGSSRQTILVVEGSIVRSRLLSSREAARLMGLPDSYKLPARYNDAYHVAGDGVCVNVVLYLSKFLLEPIVESQHEPELLRAVG